MKEMEKGRGHERKGKRRKLKKFIENATWRLFIMKRKVHGLEVKVVFCLHQQWGFPSSRKISRKFSINNMKMCIMRKIKGSDYYCDWECKWKKKRKINDFVKKKLIACIMTTTTTSACHIIFSHSYRMTFSHERI
jgi:hypothetical protein